jgi:predicted porin
MEVVPRKRRPFLTLEKLQMKKTLVAIAALASVSAFAQSSVTISGLVDLGYGSQKTYGDNTSAVLQNMSKTSTFKFAGTEDLGGGLNANFQFEVQPSYVAGNGNVTTAATHGTTTTAAYANGGSVTGTVGQTAQSGLVGKGQNWLGLQSASAGGIRLGTINTSTLAAHAVAAQAFGTNLGSGYKEVVSEYTRYENSFAYATPTINGFSGNFLRATGMDQTYGTTTALTLRRPEVNEVALNYAQGPITATAVSLKSKTSPNEAAASANITTRVTTMAGKYDAGIVRLGAFSQSLSDDIASTPTKYKTGLYTIEVPVGAFTFTGLTGVQKYTGLGAATSATKTTGDNKVTSVQAKYDLSKRTYVYLMSVNRTVAASTNWATVVSNGAALTSAPNDNKISTTGLGIVHNF